MEKKYFPSYLNIIDFEKRIEKLNNLLNPCTICPFKCKINRFEESTGRCRTGYPLRIASYNLHFGEEPPITGTKGSGTIFFSGCSLRCFFCQNYPISQLLNGNEVSIEELAGFMLSLQKKGAHNINLVTPTHFVPQIVEALNIAVKRGLHIPIVYNSSGYDDIDVLKTLDGIIDIYLPDMKYGDNENAQKYSGAKNYVEINKIAIREMYNQVGELILDENGVAKRGLIIRHLVLPNNISGTKNVLEFIAGLSNTITVGLMSQYFPAHKAVNIAEINRKINYSEYKIARSLLDRFGLINGWTQSI